MDCWLLTTFTDTPIITIRHLVPLQTLLQEQHKYKKGKYYNNFQLYSLIDMKSVKCSSSENNLLMETYTLESKNVEVAFTQVLTIMSVKKHLKLQTILIWTNHKC